MVMQVSVHVILNVYFQYGLFDCLQTVLQALHACYSQDHSVEVLLPVQIFKRKYYAFLESSKVGHSLLLFFAGGVRFSKFCWIIVGHCWSVPVCTSFGFYSCLFFRP